MLLPVAYLLHKAFAATGEGLVEVVFRERNLDLLFNTLLLCGGVLVATSLLALPLAWLTSLSNLRFARFWSLLGILPLAIPSYLMAYSFLSLGGYYGPVNTLLGWSLPRIGGYWGALLALSLYTFPYLYLNLRSALLGLDPALEEAGRSLGIRGFALFWRVTLPQLKHAYLAGAFLIGLHVLGDFGTVSLMRYETFSYALYMQYEASLDQTYSAWLSLMLLGLTVVFLVAEARILRRAALHRTGRGAARERTVASLGWMQIPAQGFCLLLVLVAVILPVAVILYWAGRGTDLDWAELGETLWHSASAAIPAALLTSLLTLPLAFLAVRFTSRFSGMIGRIAYLGYATPGLAFGLGLLFFSLRSAPVLHQTLGLLILAYALHFLAEAMGPVRSALEQAPPSLEEAARVLGCSRVGAFCRVTLPLLRRGLLASTAFVFLSVMKELPITYILSPLDRETLAVAVWGFIDEAMFAEAAPYALTILFFSALFVGSLLTQEKRSC
jgi:iron(III) transport system permease protein